MVRTLGNSCNGGNLRCGQRDSRGRNPFVWFLLACPITPVLSWNLFAPMPFGWFLITGLISPLLAAVLLFLMPVLPASRAKATVFSPESSRGSRVEGAAGAGERDEKVSLLRRTHQARGYRL
jgi:hypothetical protein